MLKCSQSNQSFKLVLVNKISRKTEVTFQSSMFNCPEFLKNCSTTSNRKFYPNFYANFSFVIETYEVIFPNLRKSLECSQNSYTGLAIFCTLFCQKALTLFTQKFGFSRCDFPFCFKFISFVEKNSTIKQQNFQ